MEIVGNWDKESVISVLAKGREVADRLKEELHPSVSSREACGFLVDTLLSTYEKALSLIKCDALLGPKRGRHSSKIRKRNSLMGPNSPSAHQRSEGFSPISVDQPHVPKKRKLAAGRSEVVRVCAETGVEGQTGDGYNWRKYGQKKILGANHPRAYYRCSHRHSRGCLAKKQIQKTEASPFMVDVIYRGEHTCIPESEEHITENVDLHKKEEAIVQHLLPKKPELEHGIQQLSDKEDMPTFSIPSTSGEHVDMGTHFFFEPTSLLETMNSPPFVSPATSESFFSMSAASHMNDFGFSQNVPSVESDFTEIASNPAPEAYFSDTDLDFLIEQVDFGSPLIDDCFFL